MAKKAKRVVYIKASQNPLDVDAQKKRYESLFDDVIVDEEKKVKVSGTKKCNFKRAAISTYIAGRFNEDELNESVNKIKDFLRGRERLFWIYGVMLDEDVNRKAAVSFYDHHVANLNESKSLSKGFWRGEIETKTFFQRIKSVLGYHTASELDLKNLKELMVKRWGKDWRKSSPAFRFAAVEAIEFSVRLNKEKPEVKSGFAVMTQKDAIAEVYKHLKLLRIGVNNLTALKNIYSRNSNFEA